MAAKYRAIPANAPTPATAPVSQAATAATLRGVAPMRRNAAKRSARWDAPRSVTMAMRSSTGMSVATAPMSAIALYGRPA